MIPAETQEETLQLESLELQDTCIKQVNTIQDQDSKPLQAQNIWETEVPDAQDTSDTQDDGILNLMMKNVILIYQMT